ncbi:hypothetical protein [uncultured Enterovirga sp.]|uniref:hypothetical protein n=1 Tax=uncultured Enterovirga sp. TaxID=2026352 RepID=UPI0035CB747E
MDEDVELRALQQAAAGIAQLDEAAQKRVLTWLCDKFNVSRAATPAHIRESTPNVAASEGASQTFADLYHAVGPKLDREKVVVAAYWQKTQGATQFQSIELNAMLKDLGHGVGNVTDALSSAMREKPALIIQLRKAGSSRQARKSYKVTEAGCRWVEARLTREAEQ